MEKTSIKDIVLAVTYRCNSRCTMCNIWKKTDNLEGLSPDDFKKLPADARDINLTGGEPFLRADLPEIIRIIKGRCPKTNIIISTNGFATGLILSQMRKIVGIFPEIGVAVSLDGLEGKHDSIRGIPGGFKRVMETIEGLKQMRVRSLKIGFTLGDYNTEELAKVYGLSKELGVEFTLSVVHSSDNFFSIENKIEHKGKLIEKLDWLIKEELSGWSPKRWARAYFAYGMKHYLQTGKRLLPDYSGKENIFIDPMGDIYPCDISSQKIGTLQAMEKGLEPAGENHCAESWMICTARAAMKKNLLKAGLWILKNKFLS